MANDLGQLKDEVIEGMVSFMTPSDDDPDFDAGYTQVHIDRCAAILESFIISVKAPLPNDKIMASVRTTVLALNTLNEEAGESLIETDQREQICALIIAGANQAGLKTDEDITEEWREW